MDVYEALYTTRSMRRVKPDPIPADAQVRILDAAIRAPSGGNRQGWRFILVDDPDLRSRLGPIYQDCMKRLWEGPYAPAVTAARASPDVPENAALLRMVRSAQHLADHFAATPLLLFAFAQSDASGGSIFPAIWSAMLAARAEGVGTALTTILKMREAEVLALLGVPEGEDWQMTACVTMGYPLGRWGVAERQPVDQVAARNSWDGPLGFEAPAPLWPR